MARFVRDEKRTYPFAWLIIGGLFAASSVWALYAELVTRVPWQEYQGDFYNLEYELARQALEEAKANWETESAKDPLKSQLARLEELQAQQQTGDYAAAKKRLAELDQDFGDAELKKTFAGRSSCASA